MSVEIEFLALKQESRILGHSFNPVLQGGRKTVTILTPPLSLAWVDRSGSYFRCLK